MNRNEIIAALTTEINRLTSARDLLAGQDFGTPERAGGGRRASVTATALTQQEFAPKRRGGMSADGKARVAEAQRKRWAKQKRENAKILRVAARGKKRAALAEASTPVPSKRAGAKKVAAPAKRSSSKTAVSQNSAATLVE